MRPVLIALLAAGCTGDSLDIVVDGEPSGLLGVSGTAADDVWVVGADATALHYDGSDWQRIETGLDADIWWVHAVPDGPVFMGGSNATVAQVVGGEVTRMGTPGPGRRTVFGVWASGPDDVWAVGGHAGRSGFAWHYDGQTWTDERLPIDIPRQDNGELPALLKVWGDGEGTVWVVGDRGTVLRSRFGGPLQVVPTTTPARLFSVNGSGSDVIAVGENAGNGVILEYDQESDTWENVTPGSLRLLQGVVRLPGGDAVAVGATGEVVRRRNGSWSVDNNSVDLSDLNVEPTQPGLPFIGGSLHGVWGADADTVWAVGGNVLTTALSDGLILSTDGNIPALQPLPQPDPDAPVTCPDAFIEPAPDGTVARGWNEQVLGAIRRDIPEPGVHARNLFHTSVALWDAWAAFDDTANGYITDTTADGSDADRHVAMSYAAHEVLTHRYRNSVGGAESLACFDAYMGVLGLDPAVDDTTGESPTALGNRIGKAIVEQFADDGANEAGGYDDPNGYEPSNVLLTVDSISYEPTDPSVWSPLNLSVAVTQNGIAADSGVQQYIGPHWGNVETFALQRPSANAPYFEPNLPLFDDAEMNAWVVDVIERTAWLDHTDGVIVDISPGSLGNSTLGTDDGTGRAVNPITNQPYAPNPVLRGDFGRILAEYWADGPDSETPPGHWNTIANRVVEHPDFEPRLYGETLVDPLAWDVAMYFTLNGAVHDAAIAAWELKRASESARPIALIRHKAALGQSSDPSLPSYHPDGLPLIPGLIELVTVGSSLPTGRHEHLRHFQGEVVIYTWRGEPGDDKTEVGGHSWERGKEWMPYQRRTFVSPAFPGYVSGHSTFSRAGAEALTGLTGSPFFPGGLGTFTAEQNEYLKFEDGPTQTVVLQWATYQDAADQAGQSRLWGGIHIAPDDFDGREMGAVCGELALDEARQYIQPGATQSR